MKSFAAIAVLGIATSGSAQEPQISEFSTKAKDQHFRVFINSVGTVTQKGSPSRVISSMRPHGFLAAAIDQGGRRRVFEMEIGSRREFYGDVPGSNRLGNSGPFSFMKLASLRDEKGVLEKTVWTEDNCNFETGQSLPYYTLFDRPLQSFRLSGKLTKTGDAYALSSIDPSSIRNYLLKPTHDQPFWNDPLEPFIADPAWVLDAMTKFAKGETVVFQTTSAAGGLVPIALHFSGPEVVRFAGWIKNLILVYLVFLNVRQTNLKYGGTVWIEENGSMRLAAVEVPGLLNAAGFVVRESPELGLGSIWPYFHHARQIMRRKATEPGKSSGTSQIAMEGRK